MLLDNRMP